MDTPRHPGQTTYARTTPRASHAAIPYRVTGFTITHHRTNIRHMTGMAEPGDADCVPGFIFSMPFIFVAHTPHQEGTCRRQASPVDSLITFGHITTLQPRIDAVTASGTTLPRRRVGSSRYRWRLRSRCTGHANRHRDAAARPPREDPQLQARSQRARWSQPRSHPR